MGEEKSAWGVGRGPRSSFSLESRVRDTLCIDFSAHVRVQVVCCFLKTYLRIMRLVAYFFGTLAIGNTSLSSYLKYEFASYLFAYIIEITICKILFVCLILFGIKL